VAIERFSSGAPWEPVVGYSRTVKAGGWVHVSGCIGEGETLYEQARDACTRIEAALALAGARMDQVVRTRTFVKDISGWEEVARAHREAFGEHPPAAAMYEVAAFIEPRFLVEIEAEAYLST